MTRVSLDIQGMHCSSCAALIEKSLKKVDGVKEANVNFAVEKAGYKAALTNQNQSASYRERQQNQINAMFKKFLVSFVFSAPMIYFMLFDFIAGLPGRAVLLPYVGIVSLILATPVQFIIGRGFYKGMFSALKMKTFNMDSLIAIGTSVAFF